MDGAFGIFFFQLPELLRFRSRCLFLKINSVTACPDELFQKLAQAPVAKYIKALTEINIAFVAYEEQVK